MSIVFLLALAEFGLAVRAGHVLGILTTLLCLAQLYASARLGTGILATTLVYLGMILRTYIAALVYIQVRSVWKGKIWTEFPGQYDKNAGNIVRSARDDNVRCGALAGPLRFPASSDRIGSLISRWTEQTEGVRVKSVHLGNKEGFRHVEYITTFFGFVDDIAIHYFQEHSHTVVEWHSQSRWARDFDRNATRLREFVEYLRAHCD